MATAHSAELGHTPQLAAGDDGAWLDEYTPFLEALCTDHNGHYRGFQADAIRAAVTFLAGGRYRTVDDLVAETWAGPARSVLRNFYGTETTLTGLCSFPGKLAASLDLATAAGKSYVMYGVVRILLNEGGTDGRGFRRALILCPSLTIEDGLRDKFKALQLRTDLTDLLPDRPDGVRTPNLLDDANTTITHGDICIENVHATYEGTGSSLRASFTGTGADTVVVNDEAHHVYNVDKDLNGGKTARNSTLWHDFCADPAYDFGGILGVSGTCYRPDPTYTYFADVLYRYAIRDTISDGFAKDVDYVKDITGALDDTKDVLFERLWTAHQQAQTNCAPVGIRPLALLVTADVTKADTLTDQFIRWAKRRKQTDIADRTIVVTSAKKHAEGRRRLADVDSPGSNVEFIVSVSMLTEGWDAKNVFTIIPCEDRAFNSTLLISQVLGRGLRTPTGTPPPGGWKVTVLNHKTWATAIEALVDDVLERSTTIQVMPVQGPGLVPHLTFDLLRRSETTVETTEAGEGQEADLNLLTDGTINLVRQDPSRAHELIVRDVRRTQDERRIRIDTGADDTWTEVVDFVARLLASLRREHHKDPILKDLLSAADIRTLVIDLINRSLTASGNDGHTLLSPANKILLEDAIRERVFPAQGQLFASRLVTTIHDHVEQKSSAELHASTRRIHELCDTRRLSVWSAASMARSRSGERANLDAGIQSGNLTHRIVPDELYRSPTNMVVVSYEPERKFLTDVLLQAEVAKLLTGWVKSPDSGFYEIPYELGDGVDAGVEKLFNPDFLLADPVARFDGAAGHVYVCEIKADAEESPVTSWKVRAAESWIARLNELLDEREHVQRPRYSFHLLTPADYLAFRGALLSGTAHTFEGTRHKVLRGTA
jgi:type III restriction enzyme